MNEPTGASSKIRKSDRWTREPMDEGYVSRLEAGCLPDGDLVTRVFRFSEGDVAGDIAIWQVELRGDDVLELIRLARLGMASGASS